MRLVFLRVADRVGRRRGEEFVVVARENKKTIKGSGRSFMGHDLWEQVGAAV